MRLKGKTAIVTGAASGIGRATALRFAREGAQVLAVDLDAGGLEATAGQAGKYGGSIVITVADVTRTPDVSGAVKHASDTFGGLDILFHAAGVASFKSTEECDEEEWDRTAAGNARSAFLCAKASIPFLRDRRGGAILFVSSINGIVGAPGLAAYSASKAAIVNLTRTLALELAPDRIRVNCLCPASVDTPMLQGAFELTGDPEEARRRNIARHPLGRLATPDDVAAFGLFLASDEASFVTGGTHIIDGGAILARK